MFNSDNKGKKSKKDGQKSPSVNMLSEDARVEGEIHVKNDIRISGQLDGNLYTKGKAIVSSSGEVDGNIMGVYADIAGTISGEVRVSDKLVIRKSAVIKGNVFTKTLLIEEGAQFDGELRMNEEEVDKELSSDGGPTKIGSSKDQTEKADQKSAEPESKEKD